MQVHRELEFASWDFWLVDNGNFVFAIDFSNKSDEVKRIDLV